MRQKMPVTTRAGITVYTKNRSSNGMEAAAQSDHAPPRWIVEKKSGNRRYPDSLKVNQWIEYQSTRTEASYLEQTSMMKLYDFTQIRTKIRRYAPMILPNCLCLHPTSKQSSSPPHAPDSQESI